MTKRESDDFPVLTIAQKMRQLGLAERVGKRGGTCLTPEVLQGFLEILFPFVQWLDRPLNYWPGSDEAQDLEPRRVMLLYRRGSLRLGLNRKGEWVINLSPSGQEYCSAVEVDSLGLSKMFSGYIDITWKEEFFRGQNERKEMERILEEEENSLFLVDFFRYAFSLHIVEEIYKTVNEVLQQREKRLERMRQRLEFLTDFSQALDPSLVGRPISKNLVAYSIWCESQGGVHVCSPEYFRRERLELLLDSFQRSQSSRQTEKYTIQERPQRMSDVKGICSRIAYLMSEVREGNVKPFDNKRDSLDGREVQVIRELFSQLFPEAEIE